ncbi:histone acetyltransferase complex component, partial [Nannochloropsis gaditana CCMP526]|uniref:histone acetyltransferase complex component n=1 Tax=Nannochloropsis gaditana (strain CCMP526) TaxID=1093141 RepID=UPI00029F576A
MALPDTVATMAHDSMEVSTSVHASVQDAAENSTAVTPLSKMKGDAETAAGPAAAVPPTTSQHTPGGALQLHSDMLLVGGKPGLFHCNYCMRDISNTIRIKCAEVSTCPDWDLCVDCFGAGVELGKHKNDHPYRVVDNTHYPIFSPDWTATEELLLLSALEAHGMGNWGKVAELLNCKEKTEKACMEHYYDLYLHSYGSILPKQTLGGGETTALVSEEEYRMRPLDLARYPEAVHLIGAPPPPPDGTPYERPRAGREREGGKEGEGKTGKEKEGEGKEGGPSQANDAIPGYMPLRGDFDVEHDNEAELILAEMEILPDEDPAEKQLKLMVVDVFNRKLDEREKRKAFVKEYNLIDYKALQNKEKRKPKDERELIAKLRVFARYQTPQEHEQFVLGILEAKRLRKRIEQLQQYRRLGIRTQAEALAYENEKRRREQEQQMRKQRAEASYLYESAKPSTKDRSSRYKKRHRGESDMD